MDTALPWLKDAFPLYLAPMAGVTDKVFRQICKGYGADVLVTEFVSAEGIFRRNERTREYLDFDPRERPLGVQLFGADAAHMAEAAKQRGCTVLVTRASPAAYDEVRRVLPDATYQPDAGLIALRQQDITPGKGQILVVAAGTSDLPVADEAAITAEAMGLRTQRITDVGVAGVHRILAHRDDLRRADCVIVIAGMEGALPSVVAGLTPRPVIAVPTSVGYGASFQGIAALLGMLSSCSPGITVVNIDNGFGAAMAAHRIVGAARRAAEA